MESHSKRRFAQIRVLLPVAGSFAEHTWTVVSRGCLVLIVILLVFCLRSGISDRNLVIGDFSVPERVQATGLTSNVLGRRLYDRIVEIQRIAKSAVAEQQHSPQAFASADAVMKISDIKFLGAEINLGTLVSELRTFLGVRNTQIVGELILEPEVPGAYRIEAHAIGEQAWAKRTQAGYDIDKLIETVASHVVEKFDPLSAGFYYYLKPDDRKGNLEKAIALADTFQTKENPGYLWALLLRGMAKRELLNAHNVAQEQFCAILNQERSFMPAWRYLGDSLRSDARLGALAEAEDLALHLIKERPDKAEGWRQLGNLHSSRCELDGEGDTAARYQAGAQRYFDHALELGTQQSLKISNYLTFVDYGRWHYYRRHLEEAAEYFTQAQALAPDQQSIYTTFVRTLGHPRKNEDPHDRAARYLIAETKAKAGLSQDGRPHFANFVMGELLTDEGVEDHRYTGRDSFKKAQAFLETARDSVPHPQPMYEALYARALAGQALYPEAKKRLSALDKGQDTDRLVDWVSGETLYNESLTLTQKVAAASDVEIDKNLPVNQSNREQRVQRVAYNSRDDSAAPTPEASRLLREALDHLTRADRQSCGPRSDSIKELIGIIKGKLNEAEPEAPKISGDPLQEHRASARNICGWGAVNRTVTYRFVQTELDRASGIRATQEAATRAALVGYH
jgi:hypothetical protein